jgi:hypothetical protein
MFMNGSSKLSLCIPLCFVIILSHFRSQVPFIWRAEKFLPFLSIHELPNGFHLISSPMSSGFGSLYTAMGAIHVI